MKIYMLVCEIVHPDFTDGSWQGEEDEIPKAEMLCYSDDEQVAVSVDKDQVEKHREWIQKLYPDLVYKILEINVNGSH